MRKLLSAALCVALCLTSLSFPAMADAAMDRNLFVQIWEDGARVPSIYSLAAAGDVLYMLSSDEDIYRYRAGDGEAELFAEGPAEAADGQQADAAPASVSDLFVMDGCLYGFGWSSSGIQITRLSDEGGAPVREKAFDLPFPEAGMQYDSQDMSLYVDAAFVSGGRLYLRGTNYSVGTSQPFLYEFELAEGAERVSKKCDGLNQLCPYRDGLLLGSTSPERSDTGIEPARLVIYDPATEKTELICELGEDAYNASIFWHEASQTIYYAVDAAVYSLADIASAPALCAYLPERNAGSRLVCLDGGLVAAGGYSGVYLRQADPERAASGTLIISGEYGSNAHMAVVAEHPELSITANSDYMRDMEALATAMVSGAGSMDVLLLSLAEQSVENLINKGYAMDLSAFPAIMETAAQMDQRFLAPLTRDGKLYGVPVYTNSYTASVNPSAWTEILGLSLEDLPSTYGELLDFVANYYYDYGEEHEELALCDSWDLKREMLAWILQAEVADQTRAGVQTLSFDSPRFLALMKALEAIDDSEISMAALVGENATDEDYNEFYSKEMLFSFYGGADSPRDLRETNTMTPLPLALEAEADPVIPSNVGVLLMNPRTPRPEAAAAYIASYLNHLDSVSAAIALFPNRNDPVPDPNYEENLAENQKWLESREKALEAASEENRAALQEEIKWQREWLEEYKKTGGVRVSAELIAAYRQRISPYLYPVLQTPVTSFGDDASSAVQSLLEQFSAGTIDAQAFVKELDGRVRLMMLENQ